MHGLDWQWTLLHGLYRDVSELTNCCLCDSDIGQCQPAGGPVWIGQLPAAAAVTVQHCQQVLHNTELVRVSASHARTCSNI